MKPETAWAQMSYEERNKYMGNFEVFAFEHMKEAERPHPGGCMSAEDVAHLAPIRHSEDGDEGLLTWLLSMWRHLKPADRFDFMEDADVFVDRMQAWRPRRERIAR